MREGERESERARKNDSIKVILWEIYVIFNTESFLNPKSLFDLVNDSEKRVEMNLRGEIWKLETAVESAKKITGKQSYLP